jgi:hypothetical protein
MAECPCGRSEGLSGDDRARLASTEVPLGYGRTRSAADLMVGYAAHVNRLGAEHVLHPGDDRDQWNAHDLVGTLIIRGFVQRALDLLDGELRSRAAVAVARVDERGGTGFPRSGPVRTELHRFEERT